LGTQHLSYENTSFEGGAAQRTPFPFSANRRRISNRYQTGIKPA